MFLWCNYWRWERGLTGNALLVVFSVGGSWGRGWQIDAGSPNEASTIQVRSRDAGILVDVDNKHLHGDQGKSGIHKL